MTQNKKHILVLPSWYPNAYNTSNGNFNKAYVRLLSKQNRISVLHVEHRPEVRKIEINSTFGKDGLEVLVYVPTAIGLFAKTKNNINFFKACDLGYKEVQKKVGSIDIIHNMVVWKMGLFALRLKEKYGIPYLVTEHSTALMGRHNAYNRIQKLYIIKVFKKASYVTAVSKLLLKGINGWIDLKGKGQVIPNVIQMNKQERETLKELQKLKNTFIHVSSLNNAQKNVEGILDALALNSEAHLHVIGGNNPKNIKTFEKMVEAKELGNRVKLLGNLEQKEVMKRLSQYEAMVHFSNYESFSIVCAEAMSVGLPVIFTACGGPEEYLNNETGIKVGIGDVNALASAIRGFTNQSVSFDRSMIRNTFDSIFNNEVVEESFNELYRKIG